MKWLLNELIINANELLVIIFFSSKYYKTFGKTHFGSRCLGYIFFYDFSWIHDLCFGTKSHKFFYNTHFFILMMSIMLVEREKQAL